VPAGVNAGLGGGQVLTQTEQWRWLARLVGRGSRADGQGAVAGSISPLPVNCLTRPGCGASWLARA